MYFKLLACETFTREICACMAGMPHVFDLDFSAIDSHDRPETLRNEIQEKIDRVERHGRRYDAVLLCYGLCGNAAAGIVARSTQLVVPRAHDCCAILLGSNKLFRKHFEKCPSQSFLSRGQVEHGSDAHVHNAWAREPRQRRALYAKLYGEENADHLLAAMTGPNTGKIVYVNIGPTENKECVRICKEKAVAEKKEYVQLEGSLSLIRNLMSGDWYPDDFLVVRPGRKISGVYDWDTVMEAVEAGGS